MISTTTPRSRCVNQGRFPCVRAVMWKTPPLIYCLVARLMAVRYAGKWGRRILGADAKQRGKRRPLAPLALEHAQNLTQSGFLHAKQIRNHEIQDPEGWQHNHRLNERL